MEIVVIWLALAVVAGVIAANKGRSGLGFFLLAVLLSPLIGVIAALVARPNTQKLEQEVLASGRSKKCLACAELIRADALLCKYCGTPTARVKSSGASSVTATEVPLEDRSSYRFGYKLGRFFRARR